MKDAFLYITQPSLMYHLEGDRYTVSMNMPRNEITRGYENLGWMLKESCWLTIGE